jgi:hypothetical protein
MKNLANNKEVNEELQKFNLYTKNGRNYELLFTGTYNECQLELENNEWAFGGEIIKNFIADQWENEVDGIGYVRFANNIVIDYSL